MSGAVLNSLTREELEAENARLRVALAEAGIDAQRLGGHQADQRSRAAQDDAHSAARQRAVFVSAVDFAMIVTDPAGIISDWNPGAEHVLGWSADEIRGQDTARFFTPEDRASGYVEHEMRLALQEGRAADERWHLRKDGSRFWASGEMTPLVDSDRGHLGFLKILRDRTAEHLAGAALEQTQERYRLALQATTDAIWDWDLTTNHVLWNAALEEAYGHPLATIEPTGDWWIGHIHPDDRARIDASIHAVIDGTGRAWTDEYRFLQADGSYAQVLDRGHVIRDGEGRACRMIGAMLDLTRMRSAESALRVSEERFRTILDTIEAAFAIVQVKFDADDRPVDYRFLEANPAFEREAGVNLRGKWVTEFAPNLERFWFETYGRVAKTREPTNFESYAKAFARWFDVRAVPVGEPDERQIAIFFNDVTARRQLQARNAATQELSDRLRDLTEPRDIASVAAQILGTTLEASLVGYGTVDHAAETLLVEQDWSIAGVRALPNLIHFRDFGSYFDNLRQGETVVVADVTEDRRTTAYAADLEAIGARAFINLPIFEQGRFVALLYVGQTEPRAWTDDEILFVRDVTERIRAATERAQGEKDLRVSEARANAYADALRALNETLEQRVTERTAELMQAEELLRQSQKMEAVGQLTGGLAHDFNNLLAGISGSLELMNTRIGQGRLKDVDKYMVAAQGASKRAAALTHRLLAFSRRQTLDPKATNVNTLVSGMLELIQRTVGPSVQVETVCMSDLWPTLVDPSQLENALLNLCINARDAMPAGGRITIETDHRWIDREAAQRQDMPAGQYLALSVSDTGTGMSPEVIAKAFDPFFTTKPLGQGTGLGLSMIYGFAKQSGGQVRIHSSVGEGTTVSIYLPRHQGEAEHDEVLPEAGLLPVAEDGETVLIVDDEPTVRMLVTDVLGDLGYTAVEAADGAGGLKVLQSDARIDLLITDVGLPGGLNGRQMADAARVTRPELKVLFITGYAENALLSNGQLEPGMAVLTKPFAVDTLAARIRELIAQ